MINIASIYIFIYFSIFFYNEIGKRWTYPYYKTRFKIFYDEWENSCLSLNPRFKNISLNTLCQILDTFQKCELDKFVWLQSKVRWIRQVMEIMTNRKHNVLKPSDMCCRWMLTFCQTCIRKLTISCRKTNVFIYLFILVSINKQQNIMFHKCKC